MRLKRLTTLSIVAAVITTFACCPQRHIVTKSSSDTKIEIVERIETIHDTVKVTPPHHRDSVAVALDTISTLENSVARSVAQIIGGELLSHTLESLSTPLSQAVEFKVKLRDSIIYTTETIEHTIEVERKLTPWQKIEIRGFWLLATALITLLISKIRSMVKLLN